MMLCDMVQRSVAWYGVVVEIGLQRWCEREAEDPHVQCGYPASVPP